MPGFRRFLSALTFYLYNSLVTHLPSYTIRRLYLQHILRIRIGKQTAVHMGCFFTGKQIVIGNNCVINRDCYLDGRMGIEIGNSVSLSPGTWIVSLTHDPQDAMFAAVGEKVIIGNHVWVGVQALILPGVTLAEGCVVGAGAVVTKSFEPYSIVAGVPAEKIGERNQELNYSLSYFPYFNTDILKLRNVGPR
jgi:acetyltransferase-like isoleucine patch superfamily enzyme